MKKVFTFFIFTFFIISSMTSLNAEENNSKKYEGLLYNSLTGEKIDDVEIENFVKDKNHIHFVIEGESVIKLSAHYDKKKEVKGETFEVYSDDDKGYSLNITSSDDYVAGSFDLKDITMEERFAPDYNNFGIFISLDSENEIDSDEYLKKLNEENEKQISENIRKKADFDAKANDESNEDEFSMLNLTGSAYAEAGGKVADADEISYEYLGDVFGNGKNYYRVNSIRYLVNNVDAGGAFVILYDDEGSDIETMLWSSQGGPENQITTANPGSLLHQGYVFAQVNKAGFYKIVKLPTIPYYVSDYDSYRIN